MVLTTAINVFYYTNTDNSEKDPDNKCHKLKPLFSTTQIQREGDYRPHSPNNKQTLMQVDKHYFQKNYG
jgi:hypothetical protein